MSLHAAFRDIGRSLALARTRACVRMRKRIVLGRRGLRREGETDVPDSVTPTVGLFLFFSLAPALPIYVLFSLLLLLLRLLLLSRALLFASLLALFSGPLAARTLPLSLSNLPAFIAATTWIPVARRGFRSDTWDDREIDSYERTILSPM